MSLIHLLIRSTKFFLAFMMCQGIVLNVKGSVVNLRQPLPLKSSQLSGGEGHGPEGRSLGGS